MPPERTDKMASTTLHLEFAIGGNLLRPIFLWGDNVTKIIVLVLAVLYNGRKMVI